MPTSALLLALGAAFVHAVWNVLLARARDPRAATAVALLVAEVVFAIPTWLIWNVHRAAWPFIVGTGALQLLYFTLLITAYRLAPLSVVYPIARGGAPVLVLIFGVAVLGHSTSLGQVLGVCLVAAGILLVRGTRPTAGRGIAFGLAVAGVIATYTLVDKVGVSHAGALPYLELSMLVPSLAYAAIYSPQRLRAEISLSTVVAGIATFGAYCMVLLALQRASAASVAAVRETSVVVGAFLAWRFLKEPVGLGRLGGAALVAGGIALVSLA
jgi:drug/metabolite transporter (DMT)-like permease